jgi:hypothetical protein
MDRVSPINAVPDAENFPPIRTLPLAVKCDDIEHSFSIENLDPKLATLAQVSDEPAVIGP